MPSFEMKLPILKKVQRELGKFLNKVFFFSRSDNNYAEELVLAAVSHSYVETVEGKADSLHLKIKECEWENFLDIYQENIKSYVRRLNIRSGIIAFDITAEPFYGRTNGLYFIGCEAKEGYGQEFEFLVVSLINEKKEEKIPLGCVPVHLGFDCAKAIKDLLAYANKLFRIELVLLDRGFYSADVINALHGLRYIMLMPKLNEKIKYYSDVLDYAHYCHNVKGEALTRIVLVRDKSDEFTWSFATNISLDDYYSYVNLYKKRWRIETNFRVEDEARIKSKSVFPIIRYFYFLTSLLLHSIWLVFKPNIPFKNFLINVFKFIILEGFGIEQLLRFN